MGWKVKRLTVEAENLQPIDPFNFGCAHEVTWFSTSNWVERCAICGQELGLWKGRPKT